MFLASAPILAFLVGVSASPIALPQAVTAAISPSGPSPPGCTDSYPSVFGIAVMNISTSSTQPQRRQQSDSSQATSIYTMAAVSQIGDGQIQGGMHTVTMTPVSQINDGQIQNPTGTAAVTSSAPPADPGCSATPMPAVQRASVSASMDTSMTATSPESESSSPSTSVSVSSQTSAPTPSVAVSASMTSLVSCLTNSTLQLTLSNGTLLDAHNRTGYVASNYQFQFDGPPQAGAIYTAGWSVCSGGDEEGGEQPMLALGGITTFYQCLSGRFYNLYTVNWAAQCSPVQLKITGLVQC